MSALPAGLATALRERLAGSFVQRVHAGTDVLVLELRSPGRTEMLSLVLTPGAGGVAAGASPPDPGEPAGGLLSFRDHVRGALTGRRLDAARGAGNGRFLVLHWSGAEGSADLILDASPRPNVALLRAGESHALRRPHEREGAPETWLAAPADPEPAEPPDLEALSSRALARRARRQALERLAQAARSLKTAVAASRRLVARREDDVARLGDAHVQRALADALAAVLHEVRQGQSSVRVTRLDDGTEAVLALDPRLPPGELLKRQYRAAAKAERGLAEARRQLELARDKAARLEDCAARARQLTEELGEGEPSDDDVAHVAALLSSCEGLLPRPQARAAEREATRGRPAALPEGVREFVSRDGLRILAGKSATSNDHLTFRVARGNDAWLHARDVPGPHVILVVPKGAEIPQESLLDAATVAHVLGRQGDEPRGEVIWTRAKDVRRVKGAGPGKVTVTRERVLPLRVEAERVARLRLRVPGP